jgi:hypothetical protein
MYEKNAYAEWYEGSMSQTISNVICGNVGIREAATFSNPPTQLFKIGLQKSILNMHQAFLRTGIQPR